MNIGSVPTSGLPYRLQSKEKHHDDFDAFRPMELVSRPWEAMSRKEQPEEVDQCMRGDGAVVPFLRMGISTVGKRTKCPRHLVFCFLLSDGYKRKWDKVDASPVWT
jgi:hypothetical protein